MVEAAMPGPLHLLVQSADDLPPLSALLQDAIVRTTDIVFDPRARQLVLIVSRYRWEAGPPPSRVRTALRLRSVTKLERQYWPAADKLLNLLSIGAQGGQLLIAFAGGASLRLTTECVDAVVEDLTPPWPVRRTPSHA